MPRPVVLPALVVLAALVLGGCAATPPTLGPPTPPTADADGCALPGTASDAVDASGALGASPVIDADGPFEVDRVERSVLLEGDGERAAEGDLVEVTLTLMNATTGDRAPGTARSRVLLSEGHTLPALIAAIRCTPMQSRLVAVVPSELAYGSVGQPELAIGPGDDVVFVIDVLGRVPLQAWGDPVALPDDFPALAIDADDDGRPRVAVPAEDPPAELRAAVIREGDGPVLAAGDEFLVQFQALNWRTGEIFDETWGDVPRSLLTILPGVDASLLGLPVGSRVVVVVPPADGFGSTGSPSSGVSGADTVVYVVDLLATTPAPA